MVGGGRQPWVIEAGEQVRPIPPGGRHHRVDKLGDLGAEPTARGLSLQLCQLVPQPRLGLRGVVRTVDPLRVGRQVVGNLAQDVDFALQPAGQTAQVPVRFQSLEERIELGSRDSLATAAFFLAAFSTVLRICSRRWWRTRAGGFSGALPLARAFCRTRAHSSSLLLG